MERQTMRIDVATCLSQAGMLGCMAGTAAGMSVALGAETISLGMVSFLVSLYLLASNFVDQEQKSSSVIAIWCCGIGAFLGYGCGAIAMAVVSKSDILHIFAIVPIPSFMVAVMLFHWSEFAFVVFYHTKDVSFRSLMLSPVPFGGYSVAMTAAVLEYWCWAFVPVTRWPTMRMIRATIFCLGAVLSLSGWALRTLALFTAKSNFTHLVANRKDPNHMLVTNGVYRFCRHPGYVGWFVWSVSTQLVLGNPICFATYVWVSWTFFAQRIPGEENSLLEFFGDQYLEYAREVPCGIPGISRLDR